MKKRPGYGSVELLTLKATPREEHSDLESLSDDSDSIENDYGFFLPHQQDFLHVFKIFAQETTKQCYSSVRCIMIAVDSYRSEDLEPLKGAVRDCHRLRSLFGEKGFQVDSVLLNEEATKEGILGALDAWTHEGLAASTLAVVYFAGHGFLHKLKRRNVYYLCGVDFNEEEPKSGINIDEELKKRAEECGAKHVLVLLDCCFGALYQENAACKVEEEKIVEEIGSKGIFVLATGRTEEREKEVEGEHRGVLSYYLEEALRDPESEGCIYAEKNQAGLNRSGGEKEASAKELVEFLARRMEGEGEEGPYPQLYSLNSNSAERVGMPVIPCSLGEK